MKSLQQLKSVIQAANPSILELKFGCELQHADRLLYVLYPLGSDIYCTYREQKTGRPALWMLTKFQREYDRTFQILGRPIRIADVLLAIDKRLNYAVNQLGSFIDLENKEMDVEATWDLVNDSLDAQSPETIQFLINLLVK